MVEPATQVHNHQQQQHQILKELSHHSHNKEHSLIQYKHKFHEADSSTSPKSTTGPHSCLAHGHALATEEKHHYLVERGKNDLLPTPISNLKSHQARGKLDTGITRDIQESYYKLEEIDAHIHHNGDQSQNFVDYYKATSEINISESILDSAGTSDSLSTTTTNNTTLTSLNITSDIEDSESNHVTLRSLRPLEANYTVEVDHTSINLSTSATITTTTNYQEINKHHDCTLSYKDNSSTRLNPTDTSDSCGSLLYQDLSGSSTPTKALAGENNHTPEKEISTPQEQQQQQIDYATLSAGKYSDSIFQLEEDISSKEITSSLSVSISDRLNETGYQLRALNSEISALRENPWIETSKLNPAIQSPSSLSNELVNETLNYFVNCRQRLSQMTKTYDDNDAYILLLQEKEVDLELAARIGQDLLKQNKELKGLIKGLETELTKRQDDVQQLKHELASKTSLLDTFIEEEEEQQTSSLSKCADPFTSKSQQEQQLLNKPGTSTNIHSRNTVIFKSSDTREDDGPSGFLSLNLHQSRQPNVQPFSSLPYQLTATDTKDEQLNPLTRDSSADTLGEVNTLSSKSVESQKLVENITFQLVESNKRLCELQDEIFYKGEQNMLQQERIYNLQDQLKESDRRLDDIAAENESLRKSLLEKAEIQQELTEELKSCKKNFDELLNVFLELQKESRVNRNLQQNPNATYFADIDPINDINNISFDSFGTAQPEHTQSNHYNKQHQNQTFHNHLHPMNSQLSTNCKDSHDITYDDFSHNRNIVRPLSRSSMVPSSCLQEELQESMQKICDIDHSDCEVTDECDSGIRTSGVQTASSGRSLVSDKNCRISSSMQTNSSLGTTTDTDSEDTGNDDTNGHRKPWSGFSSFMISTLVIICISVTLSSSANSAQRLHLKLDR